MEVYSGKHLPSLTLSRSTPLTALQEDPLAPLIAPKSTTTQTSPSSRQSGRHAQHSIATQWRRDGASDREMVQGDAEGGGDAAEGQIYDFRSKGEEVSKGDSQ